MAEPIVAMFYGDWYERYRSTSWFEPLPVEWMRGTAHYQSSADPKVAFAVENKSGFWRWCADAKYTPDTKPPNYEIIAFYTGIGHQALIMAVRNPQNHEQWWILMRDSAFSKSVFETVAAEMYHHLVATSQIKLSMWDRMWIALRVSKNDDAKAKDTQPYKQSSTSIYYVADREYRVPGVIMGKGDLVDPSHVYTDSRTVPSIFDAYNLKFRVDGKFWCPPSDAAP